MKATSMRKALARLGWSQAELARRTGRTEILVNKMTAGERTPDPALIEWMGEVGDAIEAIPPPPFYDRRYKYEDE